MSIQPTIASYNPKNEHDGRTQVFNNGTIRLFYSYQTIIGYQEIGKEKIICENVYSQTTGKHLNFLQKDKAKRFKLDEFKEKLNQALRKERQK